MLSKHKSRVHVPVSGSSTPFIYKSNEHFAAELARPRGTFKPVLNPVVSGQPLDLFTLYNEVASRGGSKRVTALSQWDEVASSIHLGKKCVNVGHALKCVFQTHLGTFERSHRHVDSQLFTDYSSSHIENETSASSTANLQAVQNHLRDRWNLSTDLIEPIEYRALLLALQSGLPNELDYAINTILLMSSQPSGLELSRCPQMVPLLLSTIGIFTRDPDSHEILSISWKAQCYRDFRRFWNSVVSDQMGRRFIEHSSSYYEIECSEEPSRVSVLELHDIMSYYDVEGFRVQLVAMVFRNLVVNACANSILLSQEPGVLRFVCLCIYSRHNALRQLGLDILSFLHFPVVGVLVPVISRLLADLITSPDRVDVSRGLRILRHLCESPLQSYQNGFVDKDFTRHAYVVDSSARNFEFLSQLPKSVFSTLSRIIYLRDLHILVLALDAVYAISCQGPGLCSLLFDNQTSNSETLITTLIAHLTFEPQSFGSESLIRMRVMQVPGMSPPLAPPPLTSSKSGGTAAARAREAPSVTVTTPSKGLETKDISYLLMAPLPQPHAGCYAVPVSAKSPPEMVSTVSSVSTADSPLTVTASLPFSSTEASMAQPTLGITTKTVVKSPVFEHKRSKLVTIMTSVPVPNTFPVSLPQNSLEPVTANTGPRQNVVLNASKFPQVSSVNVVGYIPPTSVAVNGKSGKSSGSFPKTPVTVAGGSGNIYSVAGAPPYPDAPTDKREFAVFWLHKNYQVHPQSSFPRVQIYADYQKAHQQQFSTGGAFSAGEFHNIIKSVFPLVDQVKVLVPNGNVEIHYNKLKHVDAPEPLEQSLGVHHMIAPFLTNQSGDLYNVKSVHSKSSSNSKVAKKRSVTASDTQIDLTSVSQSKLPRLFDENLTNGGVTVMRSSSPLVNGQSCKLQTIEIPTANGATIESTANGASILQPSVIAAPTLVIPNVESLQKRVNGLPLGACNFQSPAPPIAMPVHNTVPSVPPSQAFHTTLEGNTLPQPLSSVGAQFLQFRTLIPSGPLAPQRPVSVSSGVNSIPLASKLPTQSLPQHSRFVSQPQRSPLIVPSGEAIPGSHPQTLTCLGTLVTAPNNQINTNSHQVFVYSLATPATMIPLSMSSPGGSTLPQQQAALSVVAVSSSSGAESPFTCQWDTCSKTFHSVDQLFSHVYNCHFLPVRDIDSVCKWQNCVETGRRVPLSLLNHLHEQHCGAKSSALVRHSMAEGMVATTTTLPALVHVQAVSTASSQHAFSTSSCPVASVPSTAMATAVTKSRVSSESDVLTNTTSVVSTCTAASPGAPAATTTTTMLQSVTAATSISADRFRQSVRSDFLGVTSREGPVTKHIRLTAALILNNLATFCQSARRCLLSRESLLCDLAFAGTEASSTLLKCLSLLHSDEDGCGVPSSSASIFYLDTAVSSR